MSMLVNNRHQRGTPCAIKDCYLGLDFGTSGARACVIDGQVVSLLFPMYKSLMICWLERCCHSLISIVEGMAGV